MLSTVHSLERNSTFPFNDSKNNPTVRCDATKSGSSLTLLFFKVSYSDKNSSFIRIVNLEILRELLGVWTISAILLKQFSISFSADQIGVSFCRKRIVSCFISAGVRTSQSGHCHVWCGFCTPTSRISQCNLPGVIFGSPKACRCHGRVIVIWPGRRVYFFCI